MKPVDRRSGETILSVVIPAFNVEHYIGVALKSVLTQPRSEEIELIVVDDGSTDGTLNEILQVKEGAGGHKITVIHQENQGVSAARNAGIARAKSRYIGFLDSDDEFAANFSDVIMPLLDADMADIIEFNVGIVDSTGRIVSELRMVDDATLGLRTNSTAMLLEFARICQVHSGARVYRRELWDGIEFPVGRVYEDCFAIPLVYKRARTLYGIRDQLYYYRRRAGSITQTTTLWSVQCVAHFAADALEKSEREDERVYWLALFNKFFANQCFLTSRVDASVLPEAMTLVEATAAKYRTFAKKHREQLPALRFRTQISVNRRVFQVKGLIKRTLGLELRPPVAAPRRVDSRGLDNHP
ncbi:glycosyl transferase family 2 [Paraburkholderia sp. BL23I1N1]|uniref:glycosyltransferase family 2 protein n=1 Tax=Paraburkholderia sp. BL23I1N1 TaxID=1938802 RepID=UPI000E74F060|nr:glycosyltransferase family 2 protein [Paraburkholderia sp. BL23I1N1]RKE26307.1 glycosyl transferase family 2 [Paraburkholderia sp. BL23I1N1]